MKQHKNIILCLILLSFLSIKIFHLLSQKGITWDSAVYIGMGKYIFSAGNIGLWEPSRPLVWPLLLGILWKTGLNPITSGRILQLILSTGCIYLTYLIGKHAFDENIALLSAFFLAFTPTFLFNSSTILTGIPSTFLALLSILFLLKKRYLLAGLFPSLSFMTRFLQLFILIPIILFIILNKKNKITNTVNLVLGFSIITLPYLILNSLLYKTPLYPFTLQLFMSRYTGWIYNQPLQFYFINLLKENFLILLAITGTIIILKQKDNKKTLILGIFLLFFIFFNSIAHKEMRLTITFMPYMYLVVSYGIFKTLNLIKKNLTYIAAILFGVIWLTSVAYQIKTPSYKEYPEFTNYLKTNIQGKLWISNPIFITSTNQKADELIYYPLYNTKRITQLKEKLPAANHILINTCNLLPCPKDDKNCIDETNGFLSSIQENFNVVYHKKENECERFTFKRKTIS